MKRKFCFLVLVFLAAVILVSGIASAELKYKQGGALRMRYEYWKNLFDMNNEALDNRGFFRFKTSLWGQVDFDEDTTLYAKITNENKPYTYYRINDKKGYSYEINELFVDNLYLDLKNFMQLPWDLRLGRQDFLNVYGEGFVLMDGTPQDGSRSFYFNAAKAVWHVNDKNTLDFLYIKDNRTDDLLPVLNELPAQQTLNYTNERAFALYHKSDSIKNTHLENYYIYKIEDAGGPKLTAEKTKLNTVGSFVKYSLSPWTFRAQLADQFGHYGSNDREGLGGYVFADRDFKDATWSPQASVGFLYLSGDDRNTSKNEGWDPIFSKWPWMSELYVCSYNGESGMGYWTNLQMYRASLVLNPMKKTKLSLWYNYLRANETVTESSVFADGKERGHLPQIRLDYAVNKNINTYVLAEYFVPGNFYVNSADPALFLRTEVQIKF